MYPYTKKGDLSLRSFKTAKVLPRLSNENVSTEDYTRNDQASDRGKSHSWNGNLVQVAKKSLEHHVLVALPSELLHSDEIYNRLSADLLPA